MCGVYVEEFVVVGVELFDCDLVGYWFVWNELGGVF